jgi:predicted regulator of Ras-like GTPase activity (Roadblock/LC7/MglB family)
VNETVIKSPLSGPIGDMLLEFELKVPVWGLTVSTLDGYIIAHRIFYDKMQPEIETVISSMSASLIAISEDFIRFVHASKTFKQVVIDAEDQEKTLSFSVLLKHLTHNVLLTCIFPNTTELGLLLFEVDDLSNKIGGLVEKHSGSLHPESLT